MEGRGAAGSVLGLFGRFGGGRASGEWIPAYSSNSYWLLKHAEILQLHGSQPIK